MNAVLFASLFILVILMLAAIIFAFIRIQKLVNSIKLVNQRINHIFVYCRQITDEERKIISESINAYPQMVEHKRREQP